MSTVDGVGTTQTQTSSAKKSGFSALSSEEFTKIIFAELSNQDPLKPSDTSALLEQLGMIRSIQSDTDLSENLDRLVGENQLSAASNLIGKLISGVSESNGRVADYVLSISKTSDGVFLNLADGSRVSMSNVDEIVDPALLEPSDDDTDDTDDTDGGTT